MGAAVRSGLRPGCAITIAVAYARKFLASEWGCTVRDPFRIGLRAQKHAGRARFKTAAAAALAAVISVCGVVLAGPALAKTVSPLAVITTYLPAAAGGSAYSAQLAATGGTKPYAWSISAGSLPAGLTLHSGTGAITDTLFGYDKSRFEVVP